MATTTNYGWTTPDDTALVKDGAAAIRTLGSSVDTTTKALNPSTTLGDIEYRSSTANTNTRVGIGTTGQVLTVSGGVPAWAAPATGGGMTLINTGGTALTGATSITVSSIPATYNNLFVVIRNAKPTSNTGTDINMRINGDTGSNRHVTVTGYGLQRGTTFNSTFFWIMDQISTSGTENLTTITIPDYANTTTWKTMNSTNAVTSYNNNGTITPFQTYGIYNQTSAVSSLEFTCGNNFDGGTVFVYGVK
jgi:hypothetical protein